MDDSLIPPCPADFAVGRPLRILLAEDQAPNQVAVRGLLRRLGYRIDIVSNGREALEAAGRRDYDVVLMDVEMPVMDGLEAASRLRRGRAPRQGPRIIALTGGAAEGDRELCRAAGMEDFLAKPVRAEDLARVLDRCHAEV
ncbi:MAG TPA: response regulator [Isosphaeraceae bacterium]|jgi:CheY-like chemotaxis protein